MIHVSKQFYFRNPNLRIVKPSPIEGTFLKPVGESQPVKMSGMNSHTFWTFPSYIMIDKRKSLNQLQIKTSEDTEKNGGFFINCPSYCCKSYFLSNISPWKTSNNNAVHSTHIMVSWRPSHLWL